jgi:hypothetical protein
MRLIRLVVAASLSVLSGDDETKMNWKKHESSLLEVFSDVGSTPTASTIFLLPILYFFLAALNRVFTGGFEKNGCFLMVFLWFFRG